jgi:hypothetical protein
METLLMKIQIPIPCHQDWNEMTPAGSGKHCSACDKIVVDFTKMSNDEITNYFITNHSQKTCGHFMDTQIERKNILITLRERFKKIKISPIRIAALLSVGFIITLSGCERRTTGITVQRRDSTNEESATSSIFSTVTQGKVAVKRDSSSIKPAEPDSNKYMINGEVCFIDSSKIQRKTPME